MTVRNRTVRFRDRKDCMTGISNSRSVIAVAIALLFAHIAHAQLTDAQIKQQLLAQPPQAIVNLAQKIASPDEPETVDAQYVRADFDRSGKFQYIVAYYFSTTSNAGFLRVFKEQGTNLVLAGDEDDPNRQVGGFNSSTQLHLVDVNGDGVPEIEVTSWTADGQQELISLFSWTGSDLHNMLPGIMDIGNLEDLDNDGIMELVRPSDSGSGYDIYTLSGDDYTLWKTVPEDPSGLTAPDGTIIDAYADCSVAQPARFPAAAVRAAYLGRAPHSHDYVRLWFGHFHQISGNILDIRQVDTTTIFVGTHLVPAHIDITYPRQEDRDRDKDSWDSKCRDGKSPMLLLEFPRSEFLKELQLITLDHPLKAGDEVTVSLSGHMKNGGPAINGAVGVKITGDRDDRDKDHGEKQRKH